MTRYIIFIFSLFLFTNKSNAQDNNWGNWNSLIGTWAGKGNGQPGQIIGTDSFTFDLGQKVLVRKSQTKSVNTGQEDRIIHESLMVIYLDSNKKPSRAIYFDNEGHTINYTINYDGNKIILLSEVVEKSPVFKLTYTIQNNKTMTTTFEMSMDGQQFKKIVEGNSTRIEP